MIRQLLDYATLALLLGLGLMAGLELAEPPPAKLVIATRAVGMRPEKVAAQAEPKPLQFCNPVAPTEDEPAVPVGEMPDASEIA